MVPRKAVNILIETPNPDGVRQPGFAVTFRAGDKETTWLLTPEEGAALAVELTSTLIGQAVSQ